MTVPTPLGPLPAQCGLAADFAACAGSPGFVATNGTGCCQRHHSWVPGVCNLCEHSFACPELPNGSEFKWGAMVAIVVNIAISVGMALQKSAHTLVENRVSAAAQISDEAAAAVRKKGFVGEKKWWAGFLMQVGGEIGVRARSARAHPPHRRQPLTRAPLRLRISWHTATRTRRPLSSPPSAAWLSSPTQSSHRSSWARAAACVTS